MSRSKNRCKCKYSCSMCDPGKYAPGIPKPSDRRRMQDDEVQGKNSEPISVPFTKKHRYWS